MGIPWPCQQVHLYIVNVSCYTMLPRGRKGGKSGKARAKPLVKERAPKVLPTLSDDDQEDSTHSSRASTPIQSDFGGSNVADPPTSPTPTPTPIPIAVPELPSSMPSQEASQKASRRKEPLFLIDWLKENTIIYNKRLREYRNTEKKTNSGLTRPMNWVWTLSSFKPGWTV